MNCPECGHEEYRHRENLRDTVQTKTGDPVPCWHPMRVLPGGMTIVAPGLPCGCTWLVRWMDRAAVLERLNKDRGMPVQSEHGVAPRSRVDDGTVDLPGIPPADDEPDDDEFDPDDRGYSRSDLLFGGNWS